MGTDSTATLQEFTKDPIRYLLSHLEDEVNVVAGAPLLFLLTIAIVGFILWRIFLMLHERELAQIPLLEKRLIAKDDDIKRRDEEISKLTRVLEERSEEVPATSSHVFHVLEIETTTIVLKWRSEETKGEIYSFHPEEELPETIHLVLEVHITIVAIPSQLIQDVQLEIAGQRVRDEKWESRTIGFGSRYFYFNIPSTVPLGTHPARLIAFISKNSSETIEQKFPAFEVRLARSYKALTREIP